MKLLRQNLRAPRSDDTLGRGMDAALTVALFFGIGFALDAWLGTRPIFMIALTLLAALGTFLSLKYRYDARMTELEAERAARANAGKRR
jgi:hypothetical protein